MASKRGIPLRSEGTPWQQLLPLGKVSAVACAVSASPSPSRALGSGVSPVVVQWFPIWQKTVPTSGHLPCLLQLCLLTLPSPWLHFNLITLGLTLWWSLILVGLVWKPANWSPGSCRWATGIKACSWLTHFPCLVSQKEDYPIILAPVKLVLFTEDRTDPHGVVWPHLYG